MSTPIVQAIATSSAGSDYSNETILKKLAYNKVDLDQDFKFLELNDKKAEDPIINKLLKNNEEYRAKMVKRDPEFFSRWAKTQKPDILWIGCADSRCPANSIMKLPPGDVFVHRNIANTVIHTDLSTMSVIEYGVKYLGVTKIFVCGHTACGGVKAATTDHKYGTIDTWLRHIRDTRRVHHKELASIADENDRLNRLIELHALEQVHNVATSGPVQEAWAEGKELSVHAFVYDVGTGKLKDLKVSAKRPEDISELYRIKA
mmetsp:Transcript_20991/g.36104  ORF Transcript_20991/g.36104 Transcript_20991/m.36104 type:complete len:260 (-) Transcript_20991:186-965(-)|eukprot:CAMPEP_0184691908 /NCGR_PEP_ID=MMETSP0313-20130426/606_1 /TAXON_ID=2792 /ORGANISM="Porphyridium aerugineum, Strain SAG 1380-2" /LENGTH=259 /DNA_ID=CAMNT_0027149687 /DNA_START=70 /DNA_END=849 /DNA_ORIENTATION=-